MSKSFLLPMRVDQLEKKINEIEELLSKVIERLDYLERKTEKNH